MNQSSDTRQSNLSDEAMYERMAHGWRGGKPETVCGIGSTLANTEVARKWLPSVCRMFGIQNVNDAGAGDMAWIQKVDWSVNYLPFDLIPRHSDVAKLDVTRDVMPPADAILCRHVLNHLDDARIQTALALFKQSARYLIATQFDHNEERDHREFARLDLRVYLGDYLEAIDDGGAKGCRLAIWSFS